MDTSNLATPGPGTRQNSVPARAHRVLIKHTRRVRVEHDQQENTYTKYFYPSSSDRAKYLLGLREYPGLNFRRIAARLRHLDVAVPEVLAASRFSVSTQALDGCSLMEKMLTDNEEDLLRYTKMYSDLLATIFDAGIFFGDAHFRNYIVCSGRLYALDLDNYRGNFLSEWWTRRMALPTLKKQLPVYVEKLRRRALKTRNPAIVTAVSRHVSVKSIHRLLEARLETLRTIRQDPSCRIQAGEKDI